VFVFVNIPPLLPQFKNFLNTPNQLFIQAIQITFIDCEAKRIHKYNKSYQHNKGNILLTTKWKIKLNKGNRLEKL